MKMAFNEAISMCEMIFTLFDCGMHSNYSHLTLTPLFNALYTIYSIHRVFLCHKIYQNVFTAYESIWQQPT